MFDSKRATAPEPNRAKAKAQVSVPVLRPRDKRETTRLSPVMVRI